MRRPCTDRPSYETKAIAKQTASRMMRDPYRPAIRTLYPYQCEFCRWFHLAEDIERAKQLQRAKHAHRAKEAA